jgi:hypothetical protein
MVAPTNWRTGCTAVLRVNLVAHRRERRLAEAAHQIQASLLGRLQQLEQEVQDLSVKIERLGRGDSPLE